MDTDRIAEDHSRDSALNCDDGLRQERSVAVGWITAPASYGPTQRPHAPFEDDRPGWDRVQCELAVGQEILYIGRIPAFSRGFLVAAIAWKMTAKVPPHQRGMYRAGASQCWHNTLSLSRYTVAARSVPGQQRCRL